MVYEYHQDDPRKCTAARLRKFGLARGLARLRQIPNSAIVLNPRANSLISKEDRIIVERHGLVGLDCSWNRSEEIFLERFPGEPRRLPALLAGNPTNYSVIGKLSTAEAFAAALVITGFETEAEQVLSIFNWGSTFLTLNHEPLVAYSKANLGNLGEIERQFFTLN